MPKCRNCGDCRDRRIAETFECVEPAGRENCFAENAEIAETAKILESKETA